MFQHLDAQAQDVIQAVLLWAFLLSMVLLPLPFAIGIGIIGLLVMGHR